MFLDKVLVKTKATGNTRSFYNTVNTFKTKESAKQFDVASLYPDSSDIEIAEIIAAFFNRISTEYEPIPDPIREDSEVIHVLPHEISARLKNFKKPKGQVIGDINPQLVTKFHDILALPLSIIFNQTLNMLSWPHLWKTETVTVIPKNSAPAGLTELRNLSCTPLYSKILESFILDQLRKETKLSNRQFGGIKGCGTDHFLVETWDAIMLALEEESSAANLLSVDFEKAFNRMDHSKCINALADLGASQKCIGWVSAFLFGRRMSVKIRDSFSTPRSVPGGSPQGSILGNFLFCATTDKFASVNCRSFSSSDSSASSDDSFVTAPDTFAMPTTPVNAISTPSTRGQFVNFNPPRCLLDLSGGYESVDDSFNFFRIKTELSEFQI